MAIADSNVCQVIFSDPRELNDITVPQVNCEDLPLVIAEYAANCSIASGINVSTYAMTCLCAASGVASDMFTVDCQPGSHWYERPKFWVAIVAEPGWGKSPVFNATRKKIEEIQKQLIKDNISSRRQYEEEVEEHKSLKRQDRKTKRKPVRPPERLVFIDEVTPQYAKQVLLDNPRGVLMIQNELDSILSGTDPDSRRWVAEMLSLYDGGMRTKGTKSEGTCSIDNWSASFITTVQPNIISKANPAFLDKGFLQRFVPVMMGKPLKHARHEVPRYEFDRLISTLWNMDPEEPFVFDISEDGHREISKFRNSVYDIKMNDHIDPSLRQHISKHEGLVFRLSLLYHLIEIASAGGLSEQCLDDWKVIPLKTVNKVISLLRNYIAQSARKFYADVISSSSVESLVKAAIEEFKAKASVGELQITLTTMNKVKGWDKCGPAARQNALAMLVSNSWCVIGKVKGPTRPTTVLQLNPALADIARREAAASVSDIKCANLLLDQDPEGGDITESSEPFAF